MLERIRLEFQSLDGKGQNSNVYKDKATNPIFRIPMFGRIRLEFQCLNG